MAGPYAPNDSLFGPIIHALAVEIQQGIPSIVFVWEKTPDRAPSHNQVLLPITRVKVLDDTNGKLKLRMTVSAHHLFRRTEFDANITTAYTYIMPWLQLLSAWPNQSLTGLTMLVSPSDLIITKVMEAGQPFVALVVDFNVLTEFNIPLV